MAKKQVPADPRNDPDYDSWEMGMEPIPWDESWKQSKESSPQQKHPIKQQEREH